MRARAEARVREEQEAMKFILYQSGKMPIEVEAERARVSVGNDDFEFREQDGLLIRLEEHRGVIAMDLAVLPKATNTITLKGGKPK